MVRQKCSGIRRSYLGLTYRGRLICAALISEMAFSVENQDKAIPVQYKLPLPLFSGFRYGERYLKSYREPWSVDSVAAF